MSGDLGLGWEPVLFHQALQGLGWLALRAVSRALGVETVHGEFLVADEMALERWRSYWPTESGVPGSWDLRKVLTRMKPPKTWGGIGEIEPLLILWFVIEPEGKDRPFFSVDLPAGPGFSRLHVFSQSAYLRQCGAEWIDLDLRITERRVEWLNRILDMTETDP